ncbi:RHS repeat-associated core domain-containing protein [Sorangium sp. So ce321]|uniref:RHS repeat-associated core domain-containing protein n=1 Tax=Sorangium sp. So ce321 TaxID=3133300 RepID=UPI003F646A5C
MLCRSGDREHARTSNADGSAARSAYAYCEPFGRRIERAGAPADGPVGELRLGLTGHEHDDELGLINLKGRIYDPKLKRVLTPDPVVSAPLFGQSYNRYSYVLNDPLNLVDPTGYEPTGPDCTTCAPWTPPQPPWGEGGGGVTIISGGSGDGDDGNPYTPPPGATDGYKTGPSAPPPVVRSDADGFQGGGAGPHDGSLLVQLLNERARQDRLYYEGLQRDTFRVTQWAMLGASAALLVWSGGYALLAIEELSMFGGALGMTSTQAAAANAASFTLKAVPAMLGEVWVLEGLSQNDPGRIVDGIVMAASAGASFGAGLGAGPRAGGEASGGVQAETVLGRAAVQRLQNAADRTGQRIVVIGSRASGKAGTMSDWDYILSGNSAKRHSAARSIPRGLAGGENGTGIDIWQDFNPRAPNYNPLDPTRPFIVFNPKSR